MPKGIAAGVADGTATIEFVDPALRGLALTKLFAAVKAAGLDPSVVVKTTRPLAYSAPESVVRAAGLLDEAALSDEPAQPPKGYDDGEPDMDWSRAAIDEYAAKLDPPLDTTGEKNKQDAIDAIKAAQQGAE